jgi:hypothetical protein
MNTPVLWRIAVCIFSFGLCLYSYIDKQNAVTKLRIRIPSLFKEIRLIEEENTKLQYEIDQFENPNHLMELARHGEFSHLKHPFVKDVLTVSEGVAIHLDQEPTEESVQSKPKFALAVRTKE